MSRTSHRRISQSLTALPCSSATAVPSRRRRRCRFWLGIACAPKTVASRFCSTKAARSISIRTAWWISSPTKSSGCSTDEFASTSLVAPIVASPIGWMRRLPGSRWFGPASTGFPSMAAPRQLTTAAKREVELAVLRGAADLVNEDGRRSLSAGERAFARAGAAPSVQYVFNSASWDAFDRWSEARRDSRLGVAAEYLPDEVQAYATTFNQYGSWQNEPTYGYVWYPRARAGWRPYYYGSWTTLRPWGWTWIGSDPWAWPTHHYGRWGFSAGGWFWIPGRTWGPAWVSWAYAPGYVSWCPLGWNNHAVFGFNVGGYGGYGYNHWNGWTVVPHRGFGRGYVNANVINSTHIDVRTRSTFVVRDAAPDVRGYAVPRASAPIRSVGAPNGAVVNANTAGNAAAHRGSRTRTAPGTAATADGDSTAAFRSRRSSSAPLSSNGYPAPARTPRSTSSLSSPGRQGTVSAAPDGSAGVASDPRSDAATARHAVPRGSGRVAPSTPSESTAAPSRRASEYRDTPDTYSPGISSRPEVYRAVPRSERPAARDNDIYAPTPSYRGVPGGVPDRSYRVPSSPSAPSQDAPDGSRAMPRSGSRRRIALRLSRPRAFPTHRGCWLEDRPRAQRAGTIGPTAVSGTIPAVGPAVRLRAGSTVGGIGWR